MVFKSNKSTLLGLLLLTVYFLQFFLKLDWSWLSHLQQQEIYKRWSGVLLATFILFQWLLTFTRVIKNWRKYNITIQNLHKWLGAVSPLFFYIHSTQLGYGYLLLMSYVFLFNTLLGYLNLDVLKNNSDILFKGWMIAHVALSLIITFLLVFHVSMVFYYK
ncbi:MAG: hypothetical protein ABJH82_11185 [Polaribacter sp.]|uniref:hypothetical protein n=1 Tax=Polaribacter sp. TaxID=1920175 RepID=UPI003263C5C1